MYLSEKELIALKRIKGELMLTNIDLSKKIGISRKTLNKALHKEVISKLTSKKIRDWLISQLDALNIN